MHITNKKLVEKYFDDVDDIDYLLHCFFAVFFLLKKYKSSLKRTSIQESIREENQEVYNLIIFLQRLDKLNLRDISSLMKKIKEKNPDYTKNVYVVSKDPDIKDKLDNYVKNKLWAAELQFVEDKEYNGIFLKWEGYYYKRNLQKDLNNLLD